MFTALVSGFSFGLSLILPIGAQNAFVLRQGLRREHVFVVCLICALSDALLIMVGVHGFELVSNKIPLIVPAMQIGGAIYLLLYGALFLYLAVKPKTAIAESHAKSGAPLWPIALSCLGLTFLNPHVYLDTVFLLGALSTSFVGTQAYFAFGAATASFVFFFTLGYLAKWLKPLFSKQIAWRMLDALVSLIMLTIAINLLISL